MCRWIAGLLLLTACSSVNPIRGIAPPGDPVGYHSRDLLRAEVERLRQSSVERYEHFTLGVIEMSDDGMSVCDQRQKRAVLDELDRMGRKSGVTLVVFVHGWHHNAAPDDPHLQRFRDVLETLGTTSRRPIMGLYIGWRGESFARRWAHAWNPFELPTFWTRKNAAMHIGAYEGMHLLAELDGLVRGMEHPSNMVIVGHSLGGALVLTATLAALVDYSDCKPHRACRDARLYAQEHQPVERVRAFGDLILIVNPAIEAERWIPFDNYSRRQDRPVQEPVMLVVASDADWAVRLFFPIGRWLSTNVRPRTLPFFLAERSAVGVYRGQLTHRLISAQVSKGDHEVAMEKTASWFEDTSPPFLVARAPKELIPSHGDIFESSFTNFVVAYIAKSLANTP